MIDTILGGIFSADVIEKMGDWYPIVYSWSVFACICGCVLVGCLFCYALYRWLVRWF